jgi:formyltetrahydrofolate synthetase
MNHLYLIDSDIGVKLTGRFHLIASRIYAGLGLKCFRKAAEQINRYQRKIEGNTPYSILSISKASQRIHDCAEGLNTKGRQMK